MQKMQEMSASSPGQKDILEKKMTTHSRILAWKIPWTEEPGRLKSVGLQRARHDCPTEREWSFILVTTVCCGHCSQLITSTLRPGEVSWSAKSLDQETPGWNARLIPSFSFFSPILYNKGQQSTACGLSPVQHLFFVNKVLLAHIHAHLFSLCLWQLFCRKGRIE